jgi:glycerol-3-phosphate dehydrogenase subunit C
MAKQTPDNCTACTTCTAYCPVSKVTRNFRGPKMTGPAFERFRYLHKGEEDALSYCSNCKNCDISCPNGVPISVFNMLAKAETPVNPRILARDFIVSHGDYFYSFLRYFPSFLVNFGMLNPLTRIFLDNIGIARRAPLPSFGKAPFLWRLKKITQPKSKEKVVFFPGCYANMYDAEAGLSLVKLLNRLDVEVIVPEGFVCCGVPLISSGFYKQSKKNAEINLKILNNYKALPIITVCPSCSLMLKNDYPELFPELAASGLNITDPSEFILEHPNLKRLEFAEETRNLSYHIPCHQKALGIGKPALDIIKLVPVASVRDLDAGCCGISGSYGFKKEKYRISLSVGKNLFDALKNNGTEIAVTECGTCKVQIAANTKIKTVHPLTLLSERLK